MPGMMDTILNLGMNDTVVEIVAKATDNPRFAWDSYRRFLQMYGDVVMGVQKRAGEDHDPFESVIEHLKDERYGNHNFPDVQLSVDDLKTMVQRFKDLIKERTGKSFPQDPRKQLWGSISAVFGSWNNDRAVVYRRKYGIPHDWGTAVNVQTMVFGNMGDTSATGVAFTRDPASGEKVFYGEYLINAQGEDVVAGVRTPHPIAEAGRRNAGRAPGADESARPPRKTFQGHAGPRVHGRRQPALHPANPQRQTHRPRRGADRGRDGRRAADHEGNGDQTHSGRFAGAFARADFRSQIDRVREEDRERTSAPALARLRGTWFSARKKRSVAPSAATRSCSRASKLRRKTSAA